MPTQSLKFAPFNSFADSSFFHEFSRRKLDELKLDESQISLFGTYNLRNSSLSVSNSSFSTKDLSLFQYTTPTPYIAPGSLLAVNTIETFKSFDRSKLIKEKQQQICDAILSGSALENPSILTSFQVLIFSDLKKYEYYFWFAFPAPLINWQAEKLAAEQEYFDVSSELHSRIEEWRNSVSENQWGFFLLKNTIDESKHETDDWQVSALGNYKSFLDPDAKEGEQYLAFSDPSSHDLVPGWCLRNFLLLAYHLDLFKKYPNLSVLAYRGKSLVRKSENSDIPIRTNGSFLLKGIQTPSTTEEINSFLKNVPKASGWERLSTTGKLSPKFINLGSLINPNQLADQAVDLNLKLMKWRIAPNLDLEIVKNTRCLLLGAGTLGSYIARGLLGWGVRTVTFVDSGKVSYSNPVRQPLYTFEDCKDGGKPKAECAAEALRTIYPSVDAKGVKIEIPMAGHAIYDEPTQKKEYETLYKLIEEHDAVFLLMDSREARWLPTVMCSAMGKLVFNAALGFDSYVVMRHGVVPNPHGDDKKNIKESDDQSSHPNLGCYFCNDVVAPLDSMSNRTLDQMCTVTRPGVAMLASANAVELLVSVLQHPLKGLAPATDALANTGRTNLAELIVPLEEQQKAAFGYFIPHQLRGFLGSFSTMNIRGQAYSSCSACSKPIRKEWKTRGWDFVKDALNNPKYVEDLSGLTELQKMTEDLDLDCSDGDDEWALSE